MKKKVKMSIKVEDITNILVSVFSLVYICEFLNLIGVMLANILFIVIGFLAFCYSFFFNRNKLIPVCFFIPIYTLLFLISYLYNDNADFIEILWPVAFFGIGTLFLCQNVSSRITGILFKIYLFSIVFFSLARGGVDNLGGSSSRNSISVGIVLFLSLHMIASYYEKKSISFQYPFLATIGCFLGVGRSGILLAGIILFLFVFFTYDKGKSKIRNIKLFIGALFFLLIAILFINKYVPQLLGDALFNFSWRGLKTRRTVIWTDYLNKVFSNFSDLIFGASISGTHELDYYHQNMHNSFLMLHAKFGLGGIILVLSLLFKSGYSLFKEKNMYFFTPFCMMIFRMIFDYTNFNGILDILVIVFLSYDKRKIEFYRMEEVLNNI